jgi:uncharacterized FAD-dependent dehydrogenase
MLKESIKMTKKIAIIGAGPAGFAAAEELSSKNLDIQIDVYDKGKAIDARNCPRERLGRCIGCSPCNVHTGIGGAGLMSDGKLIFSTKIGNNLGEIIKDSENEDLVLRTENIFQKYGAIFQERDDEKINALRTRALQNGIDFVYSRQAHVGSDRLPAQMTKFQKDLELRGVKFHAGKEITDLKELSDYDQIILAPGRSGSRWLETILKKEGVEFGYRPVDIGVRVEVPREIYDEITNVTRDMKFYVRSKTFNDLVRTFCVCPQGYVSQEIHEGFNLVNGYSIAGEGSKNTNFSILTTVPLEGSNTNNFAAKMAELGYILRDGRKITVQRFGDLKRGRRSKESDEGKYFLNKTLKEAEWGDISLAFVARHYINIMEGLESFNKVIPGLTNDSTLIYAPEMKFHGLRVKTDNYLKAAPRIYVSGDGAGLSRGIVGAAASGIRAAEGILREMGYKDKQ